MNTRALVALLALTTLNSACAVETTEAPAAATDDALSAPGSAATPEQSLAAMLGLGAKLATVSAATAQRYAMTSCPRMAGPRIPGASRLFARYYANGVIYLSPDAARVVCADVTDSSTSPAGIVSISGGTLHSAWAWNLGKYLTTSGMAGSDGYIFERGYVLVGGRSIQGMTDADFQRDALLPKAVDDLAAFDGFVYEIHGDPNYDHGEGPDNVAIWPEAPRLVAFLESRLDLGSALPKARQNLQPAGDFITIAFEFGTSHVDIHTGAFTSRSTSSGRTDSGRSGVVLVP